MVLRYAFTKQMANVLGLELPVVDHAMYAKIAIGRTWHDVIQNIGFVALRTRSKSQRCWGCLNIWYPIGCFVAPHVPEK